MVAACLFCALAASTAWAQQEPPPAQLESFQDQIQKILDGNEELKKRVLELEEGVEDLEKEAEKAGDEKGDEKSKKEEEPSPFDDIKIGEYVKFGGDVEVIPFWSELFEGGSESDILLNSAQFEFEVELTPCAKAVLIVQYDDGENGTFFTEPGGADDHVHRFLADRFIVNEAYIILGNPERFPVSTKWGRMIVPFGISTGDPVTDTAGVNDPLTIEIFETREDAIMLAYEWRGFDAAAYAYNGATNPQGGEDHIEHFGATAGYQVKTDVWAFDIDVNFISSVFDSIGLREAFPEALEVADFVPGIAAHVKTHYGAFSVVAEYIESLSNAEFTAVGGAADGEDLRLSPRAWQVQLGYQFRYYPGMVDVFAEGAYVAIGYSESHDLAGRFPQKRFLATYGEWLSPGVRLQLEYAYDTDYGEAEFGTGESAHGVFAQLTYEW